MLKAITSSLLMEQVLAPNFKFKIKLDDNDRSDENIIKIKGFKEASSQRVRDIIESDINDLKASILQNPTMLRAMPSDLDPTLINKVYIPRIIMQKYPELNKDEVEQVRQFVVLDSVIKNGEMIEQGGRKFLKMAEKFINIDDIAIDLIDQINPFQRAFKILSKSVDSNVLRLIRDTIEVAKMDMKEDEAKFLWHKIKEFVERTHRNPDHKSIDPNEARLGQARLFIQDMQRKHQANNSNQESKLN